MLGLGLRDAYRESGAKDKELLESWLQMGQAARRRLPAGCGQLPVTESKLPRGGEIRCIHSETTTSTLHR